MAKAEAKTVDSAAGPLATPASSGPIAIRCSGRSSRTGKPCRAWAVRGATVCVAHGGKARQVRKAAARRLALGEAEAELRKLGRPILVDPAEAMLAMVCEAAGNVAVLRRLVQSLDDQVDREPGEVADQDGAIADGRQEQLGSGLAIRTDPDNWKAAPHVWVAMYDAERERLVKWAKACRDAGVDERRVQLAEQEADLMSDALEILAEGLLAAMASGGLAGARNELPALYGRAIDVLAPAGERKQLEA